MQRATHGIATPFTGGLGASRDLPGRPPSGLADNKSQLFTVSVTARIRTTFNCVPCRSGNLQGGVPSVGDAKCPAGGRTGGAGMWAGGSTTATAAATAALLPPSVSAPRRTAPVVIVISEKTASAAAAATVKGPLRRLTIRVSLRLGWCANVSPAPP